MKQSATQVPLALHTWPEPQAVPAATLVWVQVPPAQASAVQGFESEAQLLPSVLRVQLWLWLAEAPLQVPPPQV